MDEKRGNPVEFPAGLPDSCYHLPKYVEACVDPARLAVRSCFRGTGRGILATVSLQIFSSFRGAACNICDIICLLIFLGSPLYYRYMCSIIDLYLIRRARESKICSVSGVDSFAMQLRSGAALSRS